MTTQNISTLNPPLLLHLFHIFFLPLFQTDLLSNTEVDFQIEEEQWPLSVLVRFFSACCLVIRVYTDTVLTPNIQSMALPILIMQVDGQTNVYLFSEFVSTGIVRGKDNNRD